MNVELRLQHMSKQMFVEQKNIFVCLSTTDALIESVSNQIHLKKEQFILCHCKYGYQTRIVQGWDCDDFDPLDVLMIKLLDPNLQYTLKEQDQVQQQPVNYSDLFYSESHNDRKENLYENFIDQIKANKIEFLQNYATKEIVNQINNEGWTMLHWVSYFGRLEILKLFIPFIQDINQQTNDGWTALMISIRQQHSPITNFLLEQKQINMDIITLQGSALHLACKMGNMKLVKQLFKNNANLLIKDMSDKNCYQVSNLEMKLFLLALTNKMQIVKEIQLYAQVNPFIAKGSFFNPSRNPLTPFKIKERYICFNPCADSLIRYKDSTQQKIRESIKISSIIELIKDYKNFTLRKGYFFVQLQLEHHKDQLFGFPNIELHDRWCQLFSQGINYIKGIKSGKQLNNIFIKTQIIDVDLQTQNQNQIPQRGSSTTTITRNISDLSTLIPKVTHQIPKFKDFQLKQLLISNQICCVFKAKCELDGSLYLLKCINKDVIIKKNLLREAIQEVDIHSKLKNQFVIDLHYAFQTPSYLYMAFEYCNGGSLFSILNVMERFTEVQAKFYLTQILFALSSIHNQNMIYNNLQLQNVLLTQKGGIKLINLQNYGFQSLYYRTPEYLDKQIITKESDYYQFGILAYELLSGSHPYQGNSENQIMMSILTQQIEYPEYFSKNAINLISQLTNKNENQRINFETVKLHPFFKDIEWETYFNQKYKPPISIGQIRNTFKQQKITFKDDDYDFNQQCNFKKIKYFDYIIKNTQ